MNELNEEIGKLKTLLIKVSQLSESLFIKIQNQEERNAEVERLKDELLSYRRPRGSSVTNVREDAVKKRDAEVLKVIEEKMKKKRKWFRENFPKGSKEGEDIQVHDFEELLQELGLEKIKRRPTTRRRITRS